MKVELKSNEVENQTISAAPPVSVATLARTFQRAGTAVASEMANKMTTTIETKNETTTPTFPADAKPVREGSAACAAYNEANADAIALGLVTAKRPDDYMMEREAKAKKDAEAAALRRHLERTAMAVLAQVNPTGVPLGVEAVYKGGSNYSSGWHSGWKLNIGSGYGADANRKWMVIGEGVTLTVTSKQLEKAKEKIAEVAAVNAAEAARRNAKQSVQARTEEFIKANPLFCSRAGHSRANSGETLYWGSGYNQRYSYQTAFLVTEDGSVKIGGETFTLAQWVALFDLRDEQQAAMTALKASFVTAKS